MAMRIMLVALVAVAAFFLVQGLVALFFSRRDEGRRKARERLRVVTTRKTGGADVVSIMRRVGERREDWLTRLARRISPAGALEDLLRQARFSIPPTLFLLLAAVSAVGLGVAGLLATGKLLYASMAGAAGGYAPFFLAKRAKKKRMDAFQRQLPDALDLVGRALKAGHAFNSGLKMVADEFGEPIGPEFMAMLDELNFGLGLDEALANLTERVDCPDLMFFAASVNIQRETGGNLSEIVEAIAHLVRERFKLQGRVQVLAAEGKLTAWVLIALPFLAAGGIFMLNPGYLGALFSHPVGEYMLMAAAVMMALGVIVIRRMVEIKV